MRGQTGFFSHLTLILSVFVPLDQRSASMRSKGRRLEVRDCSHLFSRPATHAQTRDLNLQNSSSSVRIKNLRMVSIDTCNPPFSLPLLPRKQRLKFFFLMEGSISIASSL